MPPAVPVPKSALTTESLEDPPRALSASTVEETALVAEPQCADGPDAQPEDAAPSASTELPAPSNESSRTARSASENLPLPAVFASASATPVAGLEPHDSAEARWSSASTRLTRTSYLSRAPARERINRRVIGVALLVLTAVVTGGLLVAVVEKSNDDAAFARKEAANYTPPPLTQVGSPTAPNVAVVGDQTVTASGTGATTSGHWPALLGVSLHGAVTTFTSPGAGYAKAGAGGTTFMQGLPAVSSGADVIIFFGGLNDAGRSPLDVAKAATRAFSAARSQAPNAKIIVVGPVVGGGASASELRTLRNALKSSAAIAKATWIDPIADAWIAKASSTTPSALSAADEQTISGELSLAVQSALK